MRYERPGFARAFLSWLLMLLAAWFLLASATPAQPVRDELPARVGRIAQVDGRVWLYDAETRRWQDSWLNQSITEDDRISTAVESRAQIGIGSTELRIASDSEVVFERLDDDRIVVRVERGSVAVRVRSAEIARELEVLAGPAAVWAQQAGHYRVDRFGATTTVTAWRGSARVRTRDQRLTVEAAQRVELMDDQGRTVVSWSGVERDPFSDWVARDERRDDRPETARYVSPEMTGVDDLDRHGRWDRHPEFGMVWVPLRVAVGWAPFRHGRWTWHARWGWTWVDEAPWGFATSHYGRWLQWHGRWAWVPGGYVARPVYSPAVVAWFGSAGSGVGISVGVGGGATVGWVPLAPWEPYVPPFRHPPRYYDKVNRPHLRPGVPPQVPTGPIAYSHLGVPQAVTVVPSDVLRQRQPVAAAVVEVPQRPMVPARPAAPTRIESGFPPPPQGLPRGRDGERDGGRAPVVAVPGGAVPVSPRETGSVPPRDIPVVAVPGGAVPVSPRETGSVPPRDMPVVSVPPRDMPMAPVRPAPVVRSAPRPVDELPPGLRGQPPVQRAPGAVPPPAPVAPVAAPQPGSPAAPVAPVSPAPRMRHAAEPVPAAGPARDAPQRPERRDGARERAERQ